MDLLWALWPIANWRCIYSTGNAQPYGLVRSSCRFRPHELSNLTPKNRVILTVQIGWCSIPILQEPINRADRIFLSRVPCRRKSLFTCSVYTLSVRNESHGSVCKERFNYPAKLRPAFAQIASMAWSFDCSALSVGCQLSLGLVSPVMSLIWKVPLPAVVGRLFFVATTLAYVFDSPLQ